MWPEAFGEPWHSCEVRTGVSLTHWGAHAAPTWWNVGSYTRCLRSTTLSRDDEDGGEFHSITPVCCNLSLSHWPGARFRRQQNPSLVFNPTFHFSQLFNFFFQEHKHRLQQRICRLYSPNRQEKQKQFNFTVHSTVARERQLWWLTEFVNELSVL